jgi:phosphoribulokinase
MLWVALSVKDKNEEAAVQEQFDEVWKYMHEYEDFLTNQHMNFRTDFDPIEIRNTNSKTITYQAKKHNHSIVGIEYKNLIATLDQLMSNDIVQQRIK